MKKGIQTISVDGKHICVSGIGQMFFESGMPMSLTINQLSKNDIGFSLLHIVDEFIKNGWKEKTIISRISDELDLIVTKSDMEKVQSFINSDYEAQREMLFKSLFGMSSLEAKKNPSKFKQYLKP